MCDLPAESTDGNTLSANLEVETPQEAETQGNSPAQSSGASSTQDFSQRKPIRTIHDPYAAFSAVAVDDVNNEVVLTDENLFKVLAYNRLDSTPPKASATEPKRMLGGLKTDIEFQCGLYVDPQNGDIYAVNNDTVDRLVIFSRQAKGDVPPDRELITPHGTFGIAVDEKHQELLLTSEHDNAVVTYNKTATGDDSPIRLLQGARTLLMDPHGMTLDTTDDLIFVANMGSFHDYRAPTPSSTTPAEGGEEPGGRPKKQNWPLEAEDIIRGSGKNFPSSITVYPRTASGDTPPLRVIQGPKTQLDWPAGITYDPRTDDIFVANDVGDSILVFHASDSGDVAPVRVIKGPKSLIKNPNGVYVDVKNDELWVANFGNHSATVYKPTASGDTAPLRVIRSGPVGAPMSSLGNPHPVAYDSKRKEILVPN